MSKDRLYRPSNGTEGMIFTDHYCDHCIHEKFSHTQKEGDKKCDILTATMLYDTNDKEYPKEWCYIDDTPTCTNWKKWDWGMDDGGNWNDPDTPKPSPSDDPNQLLIPFDMWQLLGVNDNILVTKNYIVEREIIEK